MSTSPAHATIASHPAATVTAHTAAGTAAATAFTSTPLRHLQLRHLETNRDHCAWLRANAIGVRIVCCERHLEVVGEQAFGLSKLHLDSRGLVGCEAARVVLRGSEDLEPIWWVRRRVRLRRRRRVPLRAFARWTFAIAPSRRPITASTAAAPSVKILFANPAPIGNIRPKRFLSFPPESNQTISLRLTICIRGARSLAVSTTNIDSPSLAAPIETGSSLKGTSGPGQSTGDPSTVTGESSRRRLPETSTRGWTAGGSTRR